MKKLLALGATALIASAVLASPSWAGAGGDRRIEVDYSIDYVLLEGYPNADMPVRIEVFRNATATPDSGVEIGSFEGTTSPDPQGRAGNILEVNHLGGAQFPDGDCWAPPFTPDILPGDKVQATLLDAPGGTPTGQVDYTFVRNIDFTDENGVFAGTAKGVENPDGTFDVNAPIQVGGAEGVGAILEGKRVGSPQGDAEASIVPDATGAFSASVPGTGGEAFINFLNPNPGGGAGDEATTAQPRGTQGEVTPGCPALARTAMTNVPEFVNSTSVNQPMVISGVVQEGVTGIEVAIGSGAPIAATLNNGTWSVEVPASVLQALTEGTHNVVASFQGGPAPGPQTSTIVKDTAAPVLSANLPANATYNGAQRVALSSNGDEQIRYTTDGSLPNNNSRIYDGTPILVDRSMVIRAAATDAAGNRSDASFDYKIRQATALTLNSSTSVRIFGQATVLSGSLASNGTDLAGKPVVIEQRQAGTTGAYSAVRTITTNAGGDYSVSLVPQRNTEYRARFAEQAELQSKTSVVRRVNVKALVSENLSRTTMRLGQSLTISGKVSPVHAGKTVKLEIRRNGALISSRTVRLNASSNYSLTFKPPTAAGYSVRAVFAGDADHLGNVSPTKSFRVNR